MKTLGMLVVGIILLVGCNIPTPTPQPTTSSAASSTATSNGPSPTPSGPKTSFDNGSFIVGKDIVAGLYWTKGGDGCYFARLSGFAGVASEIISNDNPIGQAIVLIEASDAGFLSNNCGQWKNITSLPLRSDKSASFSDGTWKVRDQVAAGTWKNDATSGCYWARLTGFGGTNSDIAAKDNPPGPAIVTIQASDQGFESQHCGTWTPVIPAPTQTPSFQPTVVPTVPTSEPPTVAPTVPSSSGSAPTNVVHAGSFCSPSGATGVTTDGTPMVCAPASGGRLRWKSQ